MEQFNSAQVSSLTDAQITETYMHFEHGDEAPEGVVLADSFTRTMGRVWLDGEGFVYY